MKSDVTFIILGASGDLAKKKLLPAIYHLVQKGKVKNFGIIGVAFNVYSAEELFERSREYIKNVDNKLFNKIKKRFHYFQADFNDEEKICNLGFFVRQIESKYKLKGNRMFYLSTLPSNYKAIIDNLTKCSLTDEKKNWARVVFEKPFGDNLNDAKEINKCIHKAFDEEQIYRIDHYLGKELVQNISVVRFTNIFFEPIWNKDFIEEVQFIMSEEYGVENRGKFYDNYGAVKDVFQNHMLQLLALTTMESPSKFTSEDIRDNKVKVLKKVRVDKKKVLGQYQGYTKEKGIKKNSKTETFAALRMFVDNKRWRDVPFNFITGKKMKDKITSIVIKFKNTNCNMFSQCNFNPNNLTIQIQPNEGFYMALNAKVPDSNKIQSVKMDFCHECTFGPNTPEAYENLLYDVIKGDHSAFIRNDEIEEQWKITEKITKTKLYSYKKGTYPKEADKMTNWHLNLN
ncbi:glucose-6-phosphate dehydrogenase [Candidatus Woesearchaeota archaeon]|nr:glucose-6-phosphate dehydrogenase [Candidatus Woesearchaeota archaeon]